MKRILVSDTLSEAGQQIIREAAGVELDYQPGLDEAQLAKAIQGAHGLVIRSGSKVTAKVIEAADVLAVIGPVHREQPAVRRERPPGSKVSQT